ncbi:MAG: TetR/AcrR family transcriptional regulator [Lachnospiraceae bacterium]|nr:TetR/AcrR family transcriptional regulator [Lachnospiraceae bacterium]
MNEKMILGENMTTKEKILHAALTLFSERGYDGVGVDELAMHAGVKGPAIYYHFKGKDAILEGIVTIIEDYYDDNFGNPQNITHFPKSAEELIETSFSRIMFTIHDPMIKKARKLIVTEQYRNERLSRLATKHFITGLEGLYKVIFEHMIEAKIIAPYDSGMLAIEFTAPITHMIHRIDREPHNENEQLEIIRKFMEHFVKVYGIS